MKKNLCMAGSLILTAISLFLAIYSYCIDANIFGVYFLILSIISIGVYSLVLGKYLKHEMDNKKSILFPIISFIIFTILYSIYMILFNLSTNLIFITYVSLLVLFYVSMFNYIFVITCSFYYWNSKKNKKNILTFLLITTGLIIVSLIVSLIFKSLPIIVVEAIKFIYFTAVVSLFMYFITFIFQKILRPISK